MDRARRFLESLKARLAALRAHRADAEKQAREPIVPTLTVGLQSDIKNHNLRWARWSAGEPALPRYTGLAASVALLFVAITGGIVAGGQYQGFTIRNGSAFDIAARSAGFSISEISINGNKELTNAELIAVSGITSANSMPFLDVSEVQARLKRVPLISDASVRKLYPNKLVITLVEREPYALWQKDGIVHIISMDGTVIEGFRDARFKRLPHVVGEGANLRAREFVELIESVPALKDKIRAGTLMSDRRWNLKLANGVDVKLPGEEPMAALKQLARLDADANVLDKDILAVDLRVPGRAAFRLTEASAQARAELNQKKTARKGKA